MPVKQKVREAVQAAKVLTIAGKKNYRTRDVGSK